LDGRDVAVYERSASALDPTTLVPTDIVVETFYVCTSPPWPFVRIRARRGLARVAYRLGRRPGLELDDADFNAAFRVEADDEDFAIVLLSPEMQRFMLEKTSVDWSVGPEGVKLFYRGKLRRSRMGASLDRLRRFWTFVPVELLD
jgi:hypothetical protein